MQLSEIIIQKIERDGPISFHDFMEMALYYPRLGYYTSGKIRIGKNGDYYTSPILSTLFGKLLGRQIEEMYAILEGEPVVIIEYGGGTGALCLDILNHLQRNTALYNNIKYYIIERNSLEKSSVANFHKEKIEFISNISELTGFKGCVVSNELLDNFSVHRVVMKDELMEIFVD
jgi:SAM-dependent MidA family methyltransferase